MKHAPWHGIALGSGLAAWAAFGAVACASAEPPERSARTSEAQVSAASGLNAAVQAALADAARHTGLDAAVLKVARAERVTWPDGSLGCPQPGRMYTQALVPGYRIRIDTGGQVLDYHASARGALVLCPAGRARDPLANDPGV